MIYVICAACFGLAIGVWFGFEYSPLGIVATIALVAFYKGADVYHGTRNELELRKFFRDNP